MLWEISCTSSTLAKEALLRRGDAELPGFKDVLKFIYDPYFTTGLKQSKLDNAFVSDTYREVTVEAVMEYLRKHSTGTMADAMYACDFIYAIPDETWQWAATGLVTKDLQIGVSVTTLNKVFGKGFIPKIGIMRGMPCPEDAKGSYICTEKIDGNRRLIFAREDGTIDIYTRSGHRDTGLPELEEEARRLPHGFMYDCECVASGVYQDNIALRQASASLLNAGGRRTGVIALCFDMVLISSYEEGKSNINALARKMMLAAAFNDTASCDMLYDWCVQYDAQRNNQTHFAKTIKALQQSVCGHSLEHIKALPILGITTNKAESIELAKPIWDGGGEGVMMVDAFSAYEVNPNPRKTLLKIKATKEYTLTCIGVYEGTGKYIDMLGGITVEYVKAGKVYQVGVGSGFADYQRAEYWEYPERIVGKRVEIDSFGESINKDGYYSLNCPIFKRIAGVPD